MSLSIRKRYLVEFALIPILISIIYQYYQIHLPLLTNSVNTNNINRYLSSKANYEYNSLPIINDPQYQLIGFEGVFRHGTRHFNSEEKVNKYIKYFKKLEKRGLLTDPKLMSDLQIFSENELNYTGSICKIGQEEVTKISQRLLDRWNNTILSFPIHTTNTYKTRTQETQDAFLAVFKERNETIQILNEGGKKCKNLEQDKDFYEYSTVRFYDTCSAYNQYKVELEESKPAEKYFNKEFLNYFSLSTSQPYLNLTQLQEEYIQLNQTELQQTYEQYQKEFIWKTLNKLYSVCQIESSCHQIQDRLCSYLNQDVYFMGSSSSPPSTYPLLSLLNAQDNVKQYFKKGPSNPNTYKMSCILLDHIVENSLYYILNHIKENGFNNEYYNQYKSYLDLFEFTPKKIQYKADFHFAHAETLFAFYSLFNITPPILPTLFSSSYDLSTLIPMAGNIQFEILYCNTCNSPYLIRIYINEKPWSIPYDICKNQEVCPFDTFLLYYTYIYEHNNILKCDLDGYKEICNGIQCSK